MNGPGAGAPPPQQQQVVVQQEQPPQKESKYGGLKQTVRISFVFCVLCTIFRKSGALMFCFVLGSWLRRRWEVSGLVQVRFS